MSRPPARFYRDDGDRVIRAIMKIALEVEAATTSRRLCHVCGCLLAPIETCPNCRLASARCGHTTGRFAAAPQGATA